ncbi:MAG: Type 1 glutamine amidotransferase-like domain-containing protein [Oscillospiraceae bacterium]|nr:Type 1 glutamine amidotransferase-like domain-containing protein [Oscillospiraceae bacterium]
MKKLFLASWFAGSASLLPAFAGEDLSGKKVVFIPTAGFYEMSDEERKGMGFINNADKEALKNLGFIVEELEIANETSEKIEKSITNADCIFVCGGNTFFLMQELKRKGADKMISHHIEQGKLYMGTSAGSVLMQKDFIADGVDDPTLAPDLKGDFSGLGYIDFYLYVHYGGNYWGDDDEFISKYYAKLNYKKISDNQAVTVKGEKIEIVTADENSVPAIPME